MKHLCNGPLVSAFDSFGWKIHTLNPTTYSRFLVPGQFVYCNNSILYSFCCFYPSITLPTIMKSYRNYFSFLLVVHFLSAIDDGSDILLWSLKSLFPYIRGRGEPCSTNFSFTIHQTAKNVNDFDLLQPLKRVLSEWLGKEGVSSLWREEKENKRQKKRERGKI